MSLARANCTATDKECSRPATRKNGVRDVYESPLCYSCWDRIRNRHTFECSEPNCRGRILKDQNKATRYFGRTRPKPWCRKHEHRPLSAEVIGEDARERILTGYAKSIRPDWGAEFGCWNWHGDSYLSSGGVRYGRFRRDSIGSWSAHRLAYHLFYSGGSYANVMDHRCANTLCVNPLHLQVIPQRLNNDYRGKRQDRQGVIDHWYQGAETDFITADILRFAEEHNLPLRTPRHDYSSNWEDYSMIAIDVTDTIENVLDKILDASCSPATTGELIGF